MLSYIGVVPTGSLQVSLRLRRLAVAAAALLLAAFPSYRTGVAGGQILLGILESLSPSQQARIAGAYGEPSSAIVRVAFRKGDQGWEAFPGADNLDKLQAAGANFPASQQWTVAFDGKAIGRIESRRPKQWVAYSDIGLQVLTAGEQAPHVGKPGGDFAQWGADAPVYRPLVLVSAPNAADPDAWQRADIRSDQVPQSLASFRAALAKENPKLQFADNDVELLKAYRSRGGLLLFALVLAHLAPSPDEVPGPEWTPHWFVADASGAIRFLGSEMMLIDAGDYDGDGHSELIFTKAGYDYDGYLLLWDDLHRSAIFGWNYQ